MCATNKEEEEKQEREQEQAAEIRFVLNSAHVQHVVCVTSVAHKFGKPQDK